MDQEPRKTYLLAWNPKEWEWDDLEDMVQSVFEGQLVPGSWSTISKKIEPDDRLFLIRLGVEPKGIMGSGWATSEVKEDLHFKPELAVQGKKRTYVDFAYDYLLHPLEDEILAIETLEKDPTLTSVHWHTQGSGIEIKAGVEDLERLWREHLGRVRPELDRAEWGAVEGRMRLLVCRHRSRELTLRERKIEAYKTEHGGRLPCEVCGFDFFEVYGEIGRDFAHVHHKKPLGDRSRPSETKLSDLAVVCANCHAMIHRGGDCRSMDSLLAKRR
jgi:5-methylcytosine-specific restriction protein A